MKNHPFSVINPCSMMKKKVLLLFSAALPSSLSTIRTISEIRSFSYIVPSSLSNNQSPPPLWLHRLPLYPPFVTFEKFVVFQIHSPPSEGSGEVPSTPSPAPSPSLSTIRDIREIRSLSNTLPSFGGVGGGPLHPFACTVSISVHHSCN